MITTATNPTIDASAIPEKRPVGIGDTDFGENARIVLDRRYLIKDETSTPVESPEDMIWRVARVIALEGIKYGHTEEKAYQTARGFYSMMANRVFEPNSPTLMNAGRALGQLSACYVLPVDDTLSNGRTGIYDTLRSMALVHQSGGGTGFSFSGIRPKGSIVKSTTGVASGPVSFMSLYDSSTNVVKQGGTRRGANMGILRVDHPDILDFIDCKQDTTKITNFNISVAITDAFMEAVAAGADYPLLHPSGEPACGDDGNPMHLNAQEVFDRIVQNAWATGEPGVYFIDQANRYNPVPKLGRYEATNPCGEQPLLPFDVCNLGSINLSMFIDPETATDAPWSDRIHWRYLRDVVHLSTEFLDNVIDANQYPLREVHELAHRIRRIGLGVMGFADLLIKLGVPYDSNLGIQIGKEIMEFVDNESKNASENLAQTRGHFPEWETSIWGPDETCARDAAGQRIRPMRRLRNCNTTTVAPTGTISIIAGCSSGIEPLFAVAFMRNQAGTLMPDVNQDFVDSAHHGGWYTETLMEMIATEGHIHFDDVPENIQRIFVTAHDISPDRHVAMQAAFQTHCDSAISKTTNFPNTATPDDVREIYLQAFAQRCKGVTVYRDGSRENQVLSTGKTTSQAPPPADAPDLSKRLAELERELAAARSSSRRPTKKPRPNTLKGTTRKMASPLGDVFVTINEDDEFTPFEIFATLGKAGSIAMADTEAIGRLISLALRPHPTQTKARPTTVIAVCQFIRR